MYALKFIIRRVIMQGFVVANLLTKYVPKIYFFDRKETQYNSDSHVYIDLTYQCQDNTCSFILFSHQYNFNVIKFRKLVIKLEF